MFFGFLGLSGSRALGVCFCVSSERVVREGGSGYGVSFVVEGLRMCERGCKCEKWPGVSKALGSWVL